jgi:hypothetical protein
VDRNRTRVALGISLLWSCLPGASSTAQSLEKVLNWTAPPYWMPASVVLPEASAKRVPESALSPEAIEAVPTVPLAFTGITPCRVADTRGNGFSGQYGPPQLTPAGRTITIINQCGIPAAAQAVSFNFSAVNVPGAGFLVAYPAGGAFPPVATMTYNENTPNLSNAAVVPLGTGGAITVVAAVVAIDLVIDVNGYYAPQTLVNTVNGLSGAVTLAPGTDVSITPSGQILTIGTDATSSNTASTIVRRDGSGGFGAGTVALSGNLTLPVTSSTAGNIVQNGTRLLHTFGTDNMFLGIGAGNYTMTGAANTAAGNAALLANTLGNNNTAVGLSALKNNMSGNNNTAVGLEALFYNTSGNSNIAIGLDSGVFTDGSNNICIGNTGVFSESGTIRIGTGGTQTRAFLAGVRGVTTGAADGLTVLIDSNGQLGTVSSSSSVKREIADVGETSSALRNLRPVSFVYRNDAQEIRQYGLIAEEVAEVMPELVQFSPAGRAETVRYHFLAPLLLNELQKEQRRSEEQESRIEKLLARLDALEARVAECEAPTQ